MRLVQRRGARHALRERSRWGAWPTAVAVPRRSGNHHRTDAPRLARGLRTGLPGMTTTDHAWHWRACPRCGEDIVEGDRERWASPARMLVGAVLLSPHRLRDAEHVQPADLRDDHLADVWRAMRSLAMRRPRFDPIDLVRLLDRTTGRPARPRQGWATYVLEVMADCP